jgi:uncharacterized protein YdhG (YjbR/CyaY superfamily)
MADDLPAAVAAAYRETPSPQRETMLTMRDSILQVVPDAEEVIKYRMPTFVRDGVAFAGLLAHAHHVGYYPYSGSVLSQLPEITDHYRTTKSAVHVPVDDPLPSSLVEKLIHTRLDHA